MSILIAIGEIVLVFTNLTFFHKAESSSIVIYGGVILISLIHMCNLNYIQKLFETSSCFFKNIICFLSGSIMYIFFPLKNLNTGFVIKSIILLSLILIVSKIKVMENVFEGSVVEKTSWLENTKYWNRFSDRFCWNYKALRKKTFCSSCVVLSIAWVTVVSYILLENQEFKDMIILLLFVLIVLFFLQKTASISWSQSKVINKMSFKESVHFIILQYQWMVLRGSVIGGLLIFILDRNCILLDVFLISFAIGISIYSFSYLILRNWVRQRKVN